MCVCVCVCVCVFVFGKIYCRYQHCQAVHLIGIANWLFENFAVFLELHQDILIVSVSLNEPPFHFLWKMVGTDMPSILCETYARTCNGKRAL